MTDDLFVPNTSRVAGQQIRLAISGPIDKLTKSEFVRAWSSVAYLFPHLHPDGFEDVEGGWSRILRCFAAEAWRRAGTGELSDAELYPSDAQWAGLYDREFPHTAEEIERRLDLAAQSFSAFEA